MWLWVALPGFAQAPASISAFCFLLSPGGGVARLLKVRGSRFELRGSEFGFHNKLSEYNSPPAPPSGWSGGTLDKPWTYPIPIEPPQTPAFDQLRLSRPLSKGLNQHRGISTAAPGNFPVAGQTPRRRRLIMLSPCSRVVVIWRWKHPDRAQYRNAPHSSARECVADAQPAEPSCRCTLFIIPASLPCRALDEAASLFFGPVELPSGPARGRTSNS